MCVGVIREGFIEEEVQINEEAGEGREMKREKIGPQSSPPRSCLLLCVAGTQGDRGGWHRMRLEKPQGLIQQASRGSVKEVQLSPEGNREPL